ncbi:hypothetical protein ACP70R_026325 [Stipagrostis hirtigluma subsp. patula]
MWSALLCVELCRGRPCSSYSMSPLNRGSSHRVPISILRCHTGVLLGVIGVLHPSAVLLLVVVAPRNIGDRPSGDNATGSTAWFQVLPHGLSNPDGPELCVWNTAASGLDGRRSLLTT